MAFVDARTVDANGGRVWVSIGVNSIVDANWHLDWGSSDAWESGRQEFATESGHVCVLGSMHAQDTPPLSFFWRSHRPHGMVSYQVGGQENKFFSSRRKIQWGAGNKSADSHDAFKEQWCSGEHDSVRAPGRGW
ncbi:hypothetical protein KEM48_012839 [Puccinia striiformis f. sp. tritici PST-130]|uniref:Uncharacterized protein n=1 Tax=Puccinia striiformis f. sp. tritici PST-78 TaxID=1165861 RepID=A0A0L0UQU3_9BASI|nr:hypothetical protein KEM48_012839 [Puccinia striiformis f. sp. tritici PST-130]KNE89129.1 hypothetical protein PSTG_17411 [Puccinia striiformis f. sp. tritici PST-78]KNE89130.1 hypothetical protein PSTG_17412 [Puccinia striiformis f. sp. tritici PST-78]